MTFCVEFLCVSQGGESKNTTKSFFGKSPCQKLFAKELRAEGVIFLSVSFPPFDFFVVFLAVSLHAAWGGLKNAIKMFLKKQASNFPIFFLEC
jgi:hypothetical protein